MKISRKDAKAQRVFFAGFAPLRESLALAGRKTQ
jgi:hypothetical protein